MNWGYKMTARISYQIEDYIYQNRDEFIGFSMKVNAHKRMVAYKVNRQHGTDFDGFDVVATLEYLREMELLKEVGTWGFDQLYSVIPDDDDEIGM